MNPKEKLDTLNQLALRDATHPELRALSRNLLAAAGAHGDPERAFLAMAAALCRDAITYQTDTERVGSEDIAGLTRANEHPLAVLWRGVDDCDAKPRLFVALCRAAGIPARMAGEVQGERLAHAWAEVLVRGRWLPLETTLARARLGDPPRSVPKETSGQWRYS